MSQMKVDVNTLKKQNVLRFNLLTILQGRSIIGFLIGEDHEV